MSLEAVRQDIVTAVANAVSTFTSYSLVVEYPNREIVNFDTQVDPFLRVEIITLDGKQADLSDTPLHRLYGQIHLAVAIKRGRGVERANAALDHVYPQLQRKKLGTYTRTHMAVPVRMREHNGWEYYPVLIPFWADIPTS